MKPQSRRNGILILKGIIFTNVCNIWFYLSLISTKFHFEDENIYTYYLISAIQRHLENFFEADPK